MLKKIATNTILITFSNILSKVIAYLYFILLTRSISPKQIGFFAILSTSLLIMDLIASFGLDKILIREISRKNIYFFEISFIFRMISSTIVYLIFLIIFKIFYYNMFLKYHVQIILFLSSIFFINFSKNIESFFIANQKMIFVAISQFMEKLVILFLALLLFLKFLNFKLLLNLFLLSEVIRFLFLTIAIYKKNIFLNIKKNLNHFNKIKKKISTFLKESFILFLLEVIAIIYFRIDIFMLSKLTDLKTTGLYHVSYKIFDFFITFFSGFLLTIFPLISKNYKNLKLNVILFYGFFLISIVSLVCIFFRNKLLLLFNPFYLYASTSLLILFLTLPFVYFNILLGYLFIAKNKQIIYLKIGIPLLFLNVFLNFFLIPKWSLNGAAFSTLICEIISAFLFYYFFHNLKNI